MLGQTAVVQATVTQIDAATYRWNYHVVNVDFGGYDAGSPGNALGLSAFGVVMSSGGYGQVRNSQPDDSNWWPESPMYPVAGQAWSWGGPVCEMWPGWEGDFAFDTPVVPVVPASVYVDDYAGEYPAWGVTVAAGVPLPVVSIAKAADADEAGTDPGDVGNGEFTVTRTGDVTQAIDVAVSFPVSTDPLDDEATPGDDYFAPSITVHFDANSPTATLTIVPKKDNGFEDTETVRAVLAGGSGYVVTTDAAGQKATLSLTDDPPRVSATADCRPESERPLIGNIVLT